MYWATLRVQGGVGTIIPLFMRFLEYIRVAQRNLAAQWQEQQQQQQGAYPQGGGGALAPPVAAAPQQFLQTALVDPNDPSKVACLPACMSIHSPACPLPCLPARPPARPPTCLLACLPVAALCARVDNRMPLPPPRMSSAVLQH
jgi:hypothetical protein